MFLHAFVTAVPRNFLTQPEYWDLIEHSPVLQRLSKRSRLILHRAWESALTIAGAYIVGGIIPLSAYLSLSNAQSALKLSVIVTLIALALFGGIKGKVTGDPTFRGALQTTYMGGRAPAAAFGIARMIS
jgi:VIT1/CCC1 family predicted Fe2+/Mn2+ transporter